MGPRHGVIIALVQVRRGHAFTPFTPGHGARLGPHPLADTLQYSNLWLTGIAYNITRATSMQAVACPSASTTCSVE